MAARATAAEREPTVTILRNGQVCSPAQEAATALVIIDDRIAYVGSDAGARAAASGAREVDLNGRLVTPAFVDAHLHLIQTGQLLSGMDLHHCRTREEVLQTVRSYAASHRARRLLVGQGWDERNWPDPRPPTRAELDRAAGGIAVYLARVDVHSAVVSTALQDQLPGITSAEGYRADGLLSRQAHHLVRGRMDRLFTDEERRSDASAALVLAASLGVGAVHELGGPDLGPIEDLIRVREAAEELGIGLVCYWGELASTDVLTKGRSVGAAGLAGDLCIDGSIGSHTASLFEPYRDQDAATTTRGKGTRYLSDDEIAGHVVECTRAGVQAGFHCIGDEAVAAAVDGLRRAASVVGLPALRRGRHRLEHVEMAAEADFATLATYGVIASMQPAFDALWGGPGELYEQRLGEARAQETNRWGSLHRAGVGLALGTDSPVTPLAAWETVRAAVRHSRSTERLTVEEAFAAATLGGHRAAGVDDSGLLRPGWRADLAVWEVGAAMRAASGLPQVDQDTPLPACTATLVAGRQIYGSRDWGLPQHPGLVPSPAG
jgi:predicted amidohydrolase YtcJ